MSIASLKVQSVVNPEVNRLFKVARLAILLAGPWMPSFAAAQTPSKPLSILMEAPSVDSIPDSAVIWAKSQLQGNFAGHVIGKEVEPWTGWCAKFVAHSYGAPDCGAASASELWKIITNRTVQDVPDKGAPKGLLLFWSWTDKNG